MIEVRIDQVEKQIKAICKSSQQFKHLIKKALEEVQQNPAAFPTLDVVPQDLVQDGVFFRKVKIINQRQDYRMVYAHLIRENGDQHVEFLYVNSREDDYGSPNWDLIRSFLAEE